MVFNEVRRASLCRVPTGDSPVIVQAGLGNAFRLDQ